MGFNRNNVAYQEPILIPSAQVAPAIFTASQTLPSFNLDDAKALTVVRLIHEHLVTNVAGSNNDLSFISKKAGVQGITVTYAVAGLSTPLSVSVVGQVITVNVATDGAGAATTTASAALAAILASSAATALVIPALAAGNDGTGILAAMSSSPLVASVGTNPTLDVKTEAMIDGLNPYEAVSFTQATATATIEAKPLVVTGLAAHHVITIGGTNSPRFAISIQTIYRP